MPDLTYEQYKIISEELSKPTAAQFVKVLLNEYSNNSDNLSVLLSYIPQLADKAVQMKQNVINRYCWATDLLLGERYNHPVGIRKVRRGGEAEQSVSNTAIHLFSSYSRWKCRRSKRVCQNLF